jgi:RHS repeat-associated protein
VWAADYAPFGQRIAGPGTVAAPVKTSSSGMPERRDRMQLDLRLPGQWEDEESGLYYNDRRYYDPQSGRYLSPDPLGLAGGLNAYAYVANNPLVSVDPRGLVLFAFDGTNNTNDVAWLQQRGSSLSNVWHFRDLYRDGDVRYVTGVGTLHRDDIYGDIVPPAADEGFAQSGVARIDRMIRYFNDEATEEGDDTRAMEVDVIGFSRGAAEARDFANQVVRNTVNGIYRYSAVERDGTSRAMCQRVNFRFMGLWDTVLSTHAGRSYDLAIPDRFAHVAHATALNEYRSKTLHPFGSIGAFPLESILHGGFTPAPVEGRTRVERGFLGAHADIGGGFGEDESQLAQVAFNWMVKQAETAGVRMAPPRSTVIANPVVHDKSDSIMTGAPDPRAEDRVIHYRGGGTSRLRTTTSPDGMSFADTLQFISYLPDNDARRRQFVTGTVDMRAYLEWLNAHGYGLEGLTVQ